jgi:hypothetical protein
LRRLKTTLFAAVAVVAVIYIMTQAQNIGAPWFFTAFGIFMVVVIVVSVIRAWLRP